MSSKTWFRHGLAFTLLVAGGCFQAPSADQLASPGAERVRAAASPPEPIASPVATESIASPLATGSVFIFENEASSSKFPIATGPDRNLFYFDPALREMVAIPGAGAGIANPTFIDDDRRIIFDQVGEIWAWDRLLEAKVAFQGVNLIPNVADPGFDAKGRLMVFHNPQSVYLWTRLDLNNLPGPSAEASSSAESAPAPPANVYSGMNFLGQVVSLAKVESVAVTHGGIVDGNIDGDAKLIAFVTGDGLLWVYWLRTGALQALTQANSVGTGRVISLSLNVSGSPIVFGSGDRLYLYHLATGQIDPMPFGNLAYNAMRARDPFWMSSREFYYHLDLVDGRDLFARYAWLSETVRAAFFFNNVFGEGIHLISPVD